MLAEAKGETDDLEGPKSTTTTMATTTGAEGPSTEARTKGRGIKNTLDTEPQEFYTPGAIGPTLAGVMTSPSVITTRAIRSLITPIRGNDTSTLSQGARRICALKRHIQVQQDTLETTACK